MTQTGMWLSQKLAFLPAQYYLLGRSKAFDLHTLSISLFIQFCFFFLNYKFKDIVVVYYDEGEALDRANLSANRYHGSFCDNTVI